jgi:hypothetical protein
VYGVGNTVMKIHNKSAMMVFEWMVQHEYVIIDKFRKISVLFRGEERFNNNKNGWTMIIQIQLDGGTARQ